MTGNLYYNIKVYKVNIELMSQMCIYVNTYNKLKIPGFRCSMKT